MLVWPEQRRLDFHNLRAYKKLGVEAGTEDEMDATWCALYAGDVFLSLQSFLSSGVKL
jgi:hypothetical protein